MWLVFIKSHGVAERKRLDLGNLNPIYERVFYQLGVRQAKGRWNVSRDGQGGKGCRHKYPVKDEMHEATVEGEGGARGERERATATAVATPMEALCFQKH